MSLKNIRPATEGAMIILMVLLGGMAFVVIYLIWTSISNLSTYNAEFADVGYKSLMGNKLSDLGSLTDDIRFTSCMTLFTVTMMFLLERIWVRRHAEITPAIAILCLLVAPFCAYQGASYVNNKVVDSFIYNDSMKLRASTALAEAAYEVIREDPTGTEGLLSKEERALPDILLKPALISKIQHDKDFFQKLLNNKSVADVAYQGFDSITGALLMSISSKNRSNTSALTNYEKELNANIDTLYKMHIRTVKTNDKNFLKAYNRMYKKVQGGRSGLYGLGSKPGRPKWLVNGVMNVAEKDKRDGGEIYSKREYKKRVIGEVIAQYLNILVITEEDLKLINTSKPIKENAEALITHKGRYYYEVNYNAESEEEAKRKTAYIFKSKLSEVANGMYLYSSLAGYGVFLSLAVVLRLFLMFRFYFSYRAQVLIGTRSPFMQIATITLSSASILLITYLLPISSGLKSLLKPEGVYYLMKMASGTELVMKLISAFN